MALKTERILSRTAAPAVIDSAPRYTREEAISELHRRFPDIVERIRRSLIEEDNYAAVPHIMRYRELKQLDCINLLSKDEEGKNIRFLDEYLARVNGQKVSPAPKLLPFLKEGIIKYYEPYYNGDTDPDYTILHFMLLDSDLEEEAFTVQLNAYRRMRSNPTFTYVIGLKAMFHKGGVSISDSLTNDDLLYVAENCGIMTSTEKAMMKVLGSFDPEDKAYQKDKTVSVNGLVNTFSAIFLGLNELIDSQSRVSRVLPAFPEKPENEENVCEKQQPVHVGRRDRKTGKRSIVFLGGVVIECSRDSEIRTRRNAIVRHTLSWGVRGHYRHYRSGRVVYIKPYEKGPERSSVKPKGKTYTVKENAV